MRYEISFWGYNSDIVSLFRLGENVNQLVNVYAIGTKNKSEMKHRICYIQ